MHTWCEVGRLCCRRRCCYRVDSKESYGYGWNEDRRTWTAQEDKTRVKADAKSEERKKNGRSKRKEEVWKKMKDSHEMKAKAVIEKMTRAELHPKHWKHT